jgi:hypothetical protein
MDAAQFVDLDASLFDTSEAAASAVAEKLAGRGITPAEFQG